MANLQVTVDQQKKNYEIFRNELKGTFANSVSEAKEKGHLSTFHIINSIEKK